MADPLMDSVLFHHRRLDNGFPVTSPIGALLNQVYTLHNQEIAGLKQQLDKAFAELSTVEDVKNRLRDENVTTRERAQSAESENKVLKEQLKNRLSETCWECGIYKKQVTHLRKMYNDLYKHASIRQGNKENSFEDRKSGQHDSVFTEALDLDMFTEQMNSDSDTNEASKATITRRSATPEKDGISDITAQRKENKDISPIPNRTGQEICQKSPRRNLRLTRSNKRSRFSEELPTSKKPKLSPLQEQENDEKKKSKSTKENIIPSLEDRESDNQQPPKCPITVFVPETCQFSIDASVHHLKTKSPSDVDRGQTNHSRRDLRGPCHKKNIRADVDIVVPETMPMEPEFEEAENLEEIDETGDDMEESQSQVLTDQLTARSLRISPPSHASTPVHLNLKTSKTKPLQFPDSLLESLEDDSNGDGSKDLLLCDQNAGYVPKDVGDERAEEPQGINNGTSEPSSPIFRKCTKVLRDHPSGTQSPSLFDDPESPLPSQPSRRKESETGCDREEKMSIRNAGPKHSKKEHKLDIGNGDISVKCKPSPSVLSGKSIGKLEKQPSGSDGWLSTTGARLQERSQGHSQNRSQEPATSSSHPSQKLPQMPLNSEKGKKKNENQVSQGVEDRYLDLIDEPCSPVKMTRSQRKKLSQQRDSPSFLDKSSHGRSLKQTTLSQAFVVPKQNYLPGKETFNGGRLSRNQKTLTSEEKELQDFEEAVQRSLADFKGLQKHGMYNTTVSDLDITDPRCTSTPFPAPRVSSSSSDSTIYFKKPPAPAKPTTPKRIRHPVDTECRRSPRLKKGLAGSPDETIDPNDESLPMIRAETRPHRSKSHANRSLDLDGIPSDPSDESLQLNTEVGNANGSLGPDIRLSEMDHDVSVPPAANEYQEAISMFSLLAPGTEGTEEDRPPSSLIEAESKGPVEALLSSSEGEHDDDIDLSGTSVVFGPSKSNTNSSDFKIKPVLEGKTKTRPISGEGLQREKYKIKVKRQVRQRTNEQTSENDESEFQDIVEQVHNDSFDRIPKVEKPNYAYVEVVRKKAEREQLQTYACPSCERYYAGEDISEAELKEKMKSCRHKARFAPPGTPEHFWSIGMPDTQECEERGYFNTTQHKPSKFRRKRRYNQLFKSAKDDGDGDSEELEEGEEGSNDGNSLT